MKRCGIWGIFLDNKEMIRPRGADRHELKFMPKRTICEQIGAGK